MQGFDSRLLHNIHIVSVKFGPVVRKTHIRGDAILAIASSSVAVEIAFAIQFAIAISSTRTCLFVQHIQIHRAVLLWYEEDMPEI